MKFLLALSFVAGCFAIGRATTEDCNAVTMPPGASYDVYVADYGVWSHEGKVIGYSAEEDEPIVPYDCL